MKKLFLLLFSAALVFCSVSCSNLLTVPDAVIIDGKSYNQAFTYTLYPHDEKNIGRESAPEGPYHKYPSTPYDCYIAYHKAKPCVFFASSCYDEAVAQYSDPENFDFYCLIGNSNVGGIPAIPIEVDSQLFDRLVEYADESGYDPLSPVKSKEGAKKFPQPDNDTQPLNGELHFFKISKDGAFSTSRGYTFISVDGRLCLLLYYDGADDTVAYRELPEELSDFILLILDDNEIELPRTYETEKSGTLEVPDFLFF